MNVGDYFQEGKRWRFRLHEKGGKQHEVPAPHKAEAYMDAYLSAAQIAGDRKGPLFRSLDRERHWTERRLHGLEVLAMMERRARKGLGALKTQPRAQRLPHLEGIAEKPTLLLCPLHSYPPGRGAGPSKPTYIRTPLLRREKESV